MLLDVQAWGLMGWRCGYIAYPNHDGADYLGLQLVKARTLHLLRLDTMDQTVPAQTHHSRLFQPCSLRGRLMAGPAW